MSIFKKTTLIAAVSLPLLMLGVGASAKDITVKVPYDTTKVIIEVSDAPTPAKSQASARTQTQSKEATNSTSSWPKRVCLENGDTLAKALGVSWQDAQIIAKNLGFESGHAVHVGCYVVNKDLTAKKVRG